MSNETQSGIILACCSSESRGVPTDPRPAVTVGEFGVEGDYHAGPVRRHGSSQGLPNLRHVSVVARELYDSLGETLQVEIGPGGFAENFLVEGLGDLSELGHGDLLHLGEDVVISVTEQNKPCSNLTVHHGDIVRYCVGRRGIVGTVVSTGVVRPGDTVRVERHSAVTA